MCSLPENVLNKFKDVYSIRNGWKGVLETRGVGLCRLCGCVTSDRIILDDFLGCIGGKVIGNVCRKDKGTNYFSCSGFVETLLENRSEHDKKAKNGWILL